MSEPCTVAVVDSPEGAEFSCKVVPGASRSRVLGTWNDALRVSVAAPPEGGKANRAVIELLARVLELKRAQLRIASGESHTLKRIAISGSDAAWTRERIRAALRK